ncbi:MAG TPA: ATP-binding cassette domain-containing protein [Acidimicrobiales bacterium]|nr:ATP-binding cassette domain-containing protein [Acidimicrobiales bacterium]
MSDEHLLSVRGVSVSFGGVDVLHGVDLGADAGFTGLIGPNGAGKTTLFNVITGYVRPRAGEVYLDGVALHGKDAYQVARLGVARTFQTPKLVGEMAVLDNAMLGIDGRAGARRLGRSFGTRRSERATRAEAAELLERFGLGRHLRVPAGMLSLGSQKIIEVARALLARPRLLLLDEPAAGLSGPDVEALARPLAEFASSGLAILIVEHDLELVKRLCPTVVVLEFGTVLAAGAPEEVTRRKEVVAAYLGGET